MTQPISSAKDQLTGANVAVKKIMKPFSTPVLSKRTYRELKLLKALKHENVGRNIGRTCAVIVLFCSPFLFHL
jgi:serine/threonine protein kinase